MRRLILAWGVLSFSLLAHAQSKVKPQKSAEPPAAKPILWTRGHITSARQIFKPGQFHVIGYEEAEARRKETGQLSIRERNALFRKVGIESKVAKMDDFDKDVLVLSAREYTLPVLKSDYPMLTESQLKRLKQELGNKK